MATNLQTPILNNRTRSVNFFNGRLLTGEDLTTEQQANRAARAALGQSLGSGVVYGFAVSRSTSSTLQTPVLTVTKGLALNLKGATLLLNSDVDVSLTQQATAPAASSSAFQPCAPIQGGSYVSGSGVYLLTVAPASEAEGLAQVSGTSTSTAACNSDYTADGVQFRLVQIAVSQTALSDPNHLQNVIAYQCFGVANWDTLLAASSGVSPSPYGLIDQLRQAQILTNCEVPLATLYWTVSNGIVFVDMWSVRRRRLQPASISNWPLFVGDRRMAEGEAMFLQFQDQIGQLIATQPNPGTIIGAQYFNYLPPVGVLPLDGATAAPGFTYQAFFVQGAYRAPVFIPAARLEGLVRVAMPFRPVNLANNEAVWLYQVVEGTTVLPYLIFTTIYAPFQGSAQFDLSTWNFSNFL